AGAATLPEGHTDADALAEGVRSDNAARLAAGPLFLALEGGFHGKLVGSVQYTHNEVYRSPFSALAAQARFVPPNDAGALRAAVAAEDARLDTLTVVDGQVLRTAVPFPLFCALLVEPVQGEGGIHELTAEFAEQIRLVSQEIDCPVIVDEIQSGMGRTGAFLSSAQIGLEGDYYTLAKTLGGGVAKAGVMLVRENRYREAFEMVHSSTFAKDAFSCLVGNRVLEVLEADDGAVYRRAAERGERLRRMLELIVEDYPQVLREVRGRGLILGLEFADQSESGSEEIRERARSGFFGYHLAGYLLREHRIRVFPTASAMQTLRFEPSVYITDAEVDRLEQGLRELCRLLRDGDPKVFQF
ncbi:aminotransferase class III-fold pyridoxal phosphate-dependent enzyme, partial [Nocardiopsis metallicus]